MIRFFAKALFFAVAIGLGAGAAYAQSNPGFTYGDVPTAAEWNSYFSAKQDYLGQPPVLSVSNNSQLEAITAANATVAKAVIRSGVASPGDAPPVVFVWTVYSSSPPTPDNIALYFAPSGAGSCPAVAGGYGCWAASYAPGGVDIREFGTVTGTNDTALLQSIDMLMNGGTWPAGVAKTMIIPAITVASCKPNFVTPGLEIDGQGPWSGSNIVNTAACGNTGGIVNYKGTGPFTMRNLEVSCSTNYTTQTGLWSAPTECANNLILVQPSNGTSTIARVVIDNVRESGGLNGINLVQVIDWNVHTVQEFGLYGYSFGTSDADVTGPTAQNSHGILRQDDCRVSGDYCATFPSNIGGNSVTLMTPRDFDVEVHCNAAGYLGEAGSASNKSCVDLTGSVLDQLKARVYSLNGANGSEVKDTGLYNNSGAQPNRYANIDVEITEFENYDGQDCAQFPYESDYVGNPAPLPNLYRNFKAKVNCTFDLPGHWIASSYVTAGDVYTTGAGNTYLVVHAGTTGASTPPSGTTIRTGYADGTAIVEYLQATPTASANLVGVLMEALSNFDIDLTAQNIAVGYKLVPEGSSDGTIRDGTLRLRGYMNVACLQDAVTTEYNSGGQNGYVDHVTFLDWDAHIVAGNLATDDCVSIGNTHSSTSVTWTNWSVMGGNYEGRYIFNLGGGAVSGSITGGNFTGYLGVIDESGSGNLQLGGGLYQNTAGKDATTGIFHGEASATGAIRTRGVIGISNSDVDAESWYNASGGTLTVYGRMMHAALAASPSSGAKACNYGELIPSQTPGAGGQPVNGWYCSTPGTSGSAWTSY